jgi:hypothetical protein
MATYPHRAAPAGLRKAPYPPGSGIGPVIETSWRLVMTSRARQAEAAAILARSRTLTRRRDDVTRG